MVIHVKDVNDNPPVFDRPTYETQITEEDDRNIPKEILKVIAQPRTLKKNTGPVCALYLVFVIPVLFFVLG